jgi:large subunit ribosomal protein L17
MLSNMASSLILNKRITTTVAKAKALRKYVEPLLTKSKEDTTHSRRTVFAYLQNKDSVSTLFGEVASRISERPGGYTRIIKLSGTRLGDNAEMCMMELVDFNDLYTTESAPAKKAKTRRGRKGSAKNGDEAVEAQEAAADEVTNKAEETAEAPKKKATKKKKKSDESTEE